MAATKLPANHHRRIDEYCSSVGFGTVKPTSPGGRLAVKDGWILTSETKLGKYDAVAFVGALDAMTSATCLHRDGNLAIFDGPSLKAIVFKQPPKRPDPDDVGSIDSLGYVEQIDPRRIRLYWGLPGSPIADVVLRDGIFVEHTAREDRVCGGAAVVPNVFDKDIREARKELIAGGWLPQEPPPDERLPDRYDLVGQGVIEVEACSGTGYGFCAFNYRHKKGFGLRVTTMGEEANPVIGYEADCDSAKPDRKTM